jgi:hypothetical protein
MTEKIDRLFKDNLDNYNSRIPENLWEGISNQMVRRQSRRRLLWVLFAFLVLSAAGLFTLLTLDRQSPKLSEPEEPVQVDYALVRDVPNNNPESEATIDQPTMRNKNTRLVLPGSFQKNRNTSLDPVRFNRSNRATLRTSSGTISGSGSGYGSSNTYRPAPLREVHFASYPSFRCNRFPERLSSDPLLLRTRVNHRLRSKTLGDCFEGPPSRFMIGFNGSLDFPFRSIHGSAGQDLGDYIRERNATKSEFLSFSSGIQFGYFHPSGLFARAGMQYSQINERFLYVKENVIRIQTQITIDTMINSDGSYTIHRDTSIVEVMGREEFKTSNRFSMLDIPLILGYSFDLRKLSLELNAGVIFNVLSRTGGRILNSDMVPSYYGFKDPQYLPYRNHYGLSIYGSLTILSNFYGHNQLFVEPNFRYYFKSFTRADYPLRQNYVVVGLSTGVRYYF